MILNCFKIIIVVFFVLFVVLVFCGNMICGVGCDMVSVVGVIKSVVYNVVKVV